MARPLRIELRGALYHVTSRGDGRKEICPADAARRIFPAVLPEACSRSSATPSRRRPAPTTGSCATASADRALGATRAPGLRRLEGLRREPPPETPAGPRSLGSPAWPASTDAEAAVRLRPDVSRTQSARRKRQDLTPSSRSFRQPRVDAYPAFSAWNCVDCHTMLLGKRTGVCVAPRDGLGSAPLPAAAPAPTTITTIWRME